MAGALAAGLAQAASRGAPGSDFTLETRNGVALHAEPFPLRNVRLLDGPFRRAQELDRRYLLSLEPDRLLHSFRLNFGLPSAARPYGGWEEPKCEVRGHFVGHYLSACALMYASTGDEKVREQGEAVVRGLAECQAKSPSGYLSAYPEEFIERVEKRQPVWAPYYTLHKIMAGLLDMHALAGDPRALEVARKFGDWVIARNARLTDAQMQGMLENEHGGMNECLANLYALTGEAKYLAISKRFNHQAVIGPAMRREDKLTGLHANTQFPKFIGISRQYELTGDESLRTAATFFWDTVVHERSYVIGGNSDDEHFSPKEKLSTAFGANTTETCNTYNMLKLTRHLFCWDPRVEYADYYERALYNHILASQNPETGMMCYYVPLRSGSHKAYCEPESSFWCCTGTGVENHAKYGDSIYFHDGENALYVNLFIASELDWKERGVKVRQMTGFPETDAVTLAFTCEKPARLELRIRRPSWAGSGFSATLNGAPLKAAGQPGSWLAIERRWRTGDTVTLDLPFGLRVEGFADNPDRFAFLNGPIVLCAQMEAGKPFCAVATERGEVLTGLHHANGPNLFRGSGQTLRALGATAGLTLEPFYAMHGGRSYQVYFDRLTPAQWTVKEADYAAEAARQRELSARTVDYVVPDRDRCEREHGMQGERTAGGDFSDHQWRHATEGGWFSWDVKVLPEAAQELRVTYWGSDSGNRVFDVLMDGQKIATQRLEQNRPGQFYDETYPLPAGLLAGKQHVNLRFQAHAGAMAGGVFAVRVVRAGAPR